MGVNSYIKIIVISCALLIVLSGIYIYAPNPWEPDECIVPEEYVTDEFVFSVWPPPDTKMSLGCYRAIDRGIQFNIVVLLTDSYPPPSGFSPGDSVIERTKIYINGLHVLRPHSVIVPSIKVYYLNEAGEKKFLNGDPGYEITLRPILGRGQHTIIVMTRNNMGEILEYKWSFRIY